MGDATLFLVACKKWSLPYCISLVGIEYVQMAISEGIFQHGIGPRGQAEHSATCHSLSFLRVKDDFNVVAEIAVPLCQWQRVAAKIAAKIAATVAKLAKLDAWRGTILRFHLHHQQAPANNGVAKPAILPQLQRTLTSNLHCASSAQWISSDFRSRRCWIAHGN